MDQRLDLARAVNKAIDEARRDLGNVNVLIAGRTGVGVARSLLTGSLVAQPVIAA